MSFAPLTCDFSYSPTNGAVRLDVQFNDASSVYDRIVEDETAPDRINEDETGTDRVIEVVHG